MQSPAGDKLHNVHYHLTFAKHIKIGRHGADIMGIGAKPHQMITQPEKFAEHHPDYLGTFGYRDSRQGFHRHNIRKVIGGTGQVIDAIRIGDKLVPGLPFGNFFYTPVVIADIHFQVGNLFTIKGRNITNQSVSADMMGADIQHELAFFSRLFNINTRIQRLVLLCVGMGVRGHLSSPARVTLS